MARRPSKYHPTTLYAKNVVERREVAGPLVRLACERHLWDLEVGAQRGLYFDQDAADANFEFFESVLVHPEGEREGQPFLLEPFQKFINGSTYGWIGPGGDRRFRIVYVEIGKGNGKTPLASGNALEALTLGGSATEVYCAAFSKEQAKIAWRDCHKLMLNAPGLRDVIEAREHTSSLLNRDSYSFLTVLSSEDRGISGQRIKFALIDELHEHRDDSIIRKIQKGTKSTKEPLIFIITNSGVDRLSVCYAYHEYAEKVLAAGVQGGDLSFRDDEFFAYVCGLDPEDYQEDGQISMTKLAGNRQVWAKANPGLGTILKESYLAAETRQAVNMPSAQNLTLRLNFCVWTESTSVWIPDDVWMACAVERGRDLAEELRGQRCYGGLDLARSRDVSAFVLLFPPTADREKWAVLEWYWVPELNARERSERDRVPYLEWIRSGKMLSTPGNVVDFDFITRQILDLSSIYQIEELAYDRTFAGQLVTDLIQEGITMVPFGQGFMSMGAPVPEIERQVTGGLLEHQGHPITRWMLANVVIVHDAGGLQKIDKARSKEKVDGPVALANAMGRAMLGAEPEGSVYEERGILSF